LRAFTQVTNLSQDRELWDERGDTFVYFGYDRHMDYNNRPSPSFRVDGRLLAETGSVYLTALMDNNMVYNEDDYVMPNTSSPGGSPSMRSAESLSTSGHGGTPPIRAGRGPQQQYLSRYDSHNGRRNQQSNQRSLQSMRSDTSDSYGTSDYTSSSPSICHELYFPALTPEPNQTPYQTRLANMRHHLTTRNVFAFLMKRPIVGLSLGQALTDLQERLDLYMPPTTDNVQNIIDFIGQRGLADVRNDPSASASLLVWAEAPSVRDQDVWLEAFVHCVGMYHKVKTTPEYHSVTPISRHLIERGSLELEIRIETAEKRLQSFDFSDMWSTYGPMPSAAVGVKAAFDSFRKFLVGFYTSGYWSWPPSIPENGAGSAWLTRDLVRRLQNDFGCLYNLLVDRDLIWDENEARSGRKFLIVSKGEKKDFEADVDEMRFTNMLIGFDNRHQYPHIPHPFPITPPSKPGSNIKSMFTGSKKQREQEIRALERSRALGYSDATNVTKLGAEFVHNGLVESFSIFEKTDRPVEQNPAEARKGRWILLYGILQVLATLSVDTPGIRWTQDTAYFLNPRLVGTPPWRGQSGDETTHKQSHCWVVPNTWDVPADVWSPDDRGSRQPARRVQTNGTDTSKTSHKALAHVSDEEDVTEGEDGEDGEEGEEVEEGEEEDDDGTSTIGGNFTKNWVNSAGGYTGDHESTLPIASQREKIRDWPIQNYNRVPEKKVRRGDMEGRPYVPPSDW
jgi:hypothetical protein